MSKLNVMLDLETCGTKPGCVVLSIGACTFDLQYKFYQTISHQDSLKAGFLEEIDTMRWWANQDPAARQEAFSGILPPQSALLNFFNWMDQLPVPRKDIAIWGNGADFDIPILAAQYDKLGLGKPWSPFSGRCYRTLKTLLPHVSAPVKNKQKHNALEDAIFQAQHATTLLQVL